MATTPTRIDDENYYWLMDNRGATTMNAVLTILIQHAEKCEELKKEIFKATKAKNIKKRRQEQLIKQKRR